MSELESHFSPSEIENKWYAHWSDKGYFKSSPDDREAFSIVIPPPNITGILHMGHMLNNTIQDALIRRARSQGKNACWVPGTDHASIATEAKVVQMLREKGIKKSDITREEFLKYAFEWKDKYGGIILQQLKKLGASADWDRTAFTMDEVRSEAVIKAFVDLYNRGKLYRGKRMVNWDPEAKTVLSNEEVLHSEENANLFHILYKFEGSEEGIIIATQRPETIMVDAAVAVNPNDERYKHLHGKKVIIPLINKAIPIIADDYVDLEFGTGALKVTPAHDQNDYEIGIRHGLEILDVLNDDGTLNEHSILYNGMDRFEVRKKIKADLEASGNLIKVESYRTNIGRSERTNAVVEPKLSLQWYVDTKQIAKPALDAVENGEISFYPDHMKNTYRHWMENIRDWCISRQLWWGHRVPAYYYNDEIFVAETIEKALEIAKQKTGNQNLTSSDLKQDEDVLDTWFSSWMWPISVFDGMDRSKDFDYYFPTSVLVTGWDIIFLWVARMAMASYEWKGKLPFHDVYFTGMVRDKLRRKMSKSLGNSPDALKLIDDYGADGVRFGMLACSPAGGDLLFDEKLCEQGRNFTNKLWNATRLIKGWQTDSSIEINSGNAIVNTYMNDRYAEISTEIERLYEQYKLSEVLKLIYNFAWDDFCSFYLEAIKPQQNTAIASQQKDACIAIFEKICIILHPFMPFITEEIWHQLKERKDGDDCYKAAYHVEKLSSREVIEEITELRSVLTSTKDLRNKYGVKNAVAVPLAILPNEGISLIKNEGCFLLLKKLGNFSEVNYTSTEIADSQSFLGLRNKYYLTLPISINIEEEISKLNKEIEAAKSFITMTEKKLSNEKFVANSSPDVVEKERQKLTDGNARLAALEESLRSLG
ncbi:MAG: valine--tRNA ligase [Saprospiraceae bacterium]